MVSKEENREEGKAGTGGVQTPVRSLVSPFVVLSFCLGGLDDDSDDADIRESSQG